LHAGACNARDHDLHVGTCNVRTYGLLETCNARVQGLHVTLCTAQAKEKRQAKEAQLAKAQMDAARRGGVSWGMAEEAALEEDLDSVTEGAVLGITTLKYLLNVHFQGRNDVSEIKYKFWAEKGCLASQPCKISPM